MIFIPAGLTDVYQPLDRRIFGILKAKARRYFRMRYSQCENIETTKKDAVQDFIAAWESITHENIGDAWDIYHETLADVSPLSDEMEKKDIIERSLLRTSKLPTATEEQSDWH